MKSFKITFFEIFIWIIVFFIISCILFVLPVREFLILPIGLLSSFMITDIIVNIFFKEYLS